MTVEEMEQPAKQWQVAAVQTEVKAANEKLDKLLEHDYVKRTEMEEYVREYVKQQLSKYAPLYKLFWAVVTALFVSAAALFFQIKR